MSGRISPYTGKARESFDRVHTAGSYYPNKLYYSADTRNLYYINSKGYMHIYTTHKGIINNTPVYYLTDDLLTTSNTIKEGATISNYMSKEDAKSYVLELISKAQKNNQAIA